MSLTQKNKDMPLLAHLSELRSCLLRAFFWVLGGFTIAYWQSQVIYDFLTAPIVRELKKRPLPQATDSLFFTTLFEPFLTHLKIGLYAGAVLASPFIFFEIWRFVSPGLLKKERAPLLLLAFFSTCFFVLGMGFCYAFVFPQAFGFFLSFASAQVVPILSINSSIDFISRLLFGFGLVFQLPVLVVVLAAAGIVRAVSLLHFWRYALIINAVVSAALTPPDVVSMLFMMVPLTLLYLVSMGLAYVFEKPLVQSSFEELQSARNN